MALQVCCSRFCCGGPELRICFDFLRFLVQIPAMKSFCIGITFKENTLHQDLARRSVLDMGEKLLGSLGGMFSKTWKPKKTRPIVGPVITRDDLPKSSGGHLEQREKLGLNSALRGRSKSRTPPPEPTDAYQKVEIEKAKQDDALSDLSDLLGELKVMAVDMRSEIESQMEALDGVQDDVDVLNIRVQGANQRARRLLGK